VLTLQIKRTINMPTFYGSDKTKDQVLGSRLKQWNCLQKTHLCHFTERSRQVHQCITQCIVINELK